MLPFFVYGTLLPRQPNFVLWGDEIERIVPATLSDATLFSMGHFPMMIRRPGQMVRGALIYLNTDAYPRVVATIDKLEGYHPDNAARSLYRRVAVQVTTAHDSVEAWTYFGEAKDTLGRPHIGEDWVAFSAENRTTISNWWQRYNAAGETDLFVDYNDQ